MNGSKLGRKKEQAVTALLSARSLEEAAKSVGVSVRTLQRWQKQPHFEKALRESRLAAFQQSLARLQQASVPAVTTLLKLMVDASTPLAIKARCAVFVLEQARKAIETEELEQRIAELERVTGNYQWSE